MPTKDGQMDEELPMDKGEAMPIIKKIRITRPEHPPIRELVVHLGWRVKSTAGPEVDLDASAFPLTANGTVPGGRYCVYYNNLNSPDRSIQHEGDDLDGKGGGEIIRVHLREVSPIIERIAFAVTIYDAKRLHQNFGSLSQAHIRFSAEDVGQLDEHVLSGDYAKYSGVVIGEMCRTGEDWEFHAVERGFYGGLTEIGHHYGVNFREVAPPA
jgi:tellurium resistance protein TerD